MGRFGNPWDNEGPGWGSEDDLPGESRRESDGDGSDPVGRVLGGDFPEYGEYMGAGRARAGELALELLERKAEIERLQERLRHRESEVWQMRQVIEGLKAELRSVGATMVALQEQIAALRAAAGLREASPPPSVAPSGDNAADAAALQAALADLETRLQDAVVLVLDEMNTRRAAEARVQELEALMAAPPRPHPPRRM
jgi:hypothetical protein